MTKLVVEMKESYHNVRCIVGRIVYGSHGTQAVEHEKYLFVPTAMRTSIDFRSLTELHDDGKLVRDIEVNNVTHNFLK